MYFWLVPGFVVIFLLLWLQAFIKYVTNRCCGVASHFHINGSGAPLRHEQQQPTILFIAGVSWRKIVMEGKEPSSSSSKVREANRILIRTNTTIYFVVLFASNKLLTSSRYVEQVRNKLYILRRKLVTLKFHLMNNDDTERAYKWFQEYLLRTGSKII